MKPIGITCQTLLTFAPSFPTRPDLTTRLLAKSGYLSWGCPKKPLRRISSGSPLPGVGREQARYDSLREEGASPPPCSVLAVSHRLDGFLLHPMALGTLRLLTSTVPTLHAFSACFRPWGSPRFRDSPSSRPSRAAPTSPPHPRDALLPYEAFPPCTATMTDEPIVRPSGR